MSLEALIKWLSGIMIVALIGCGAYFSFQIFFWNDVFEDIPVEPKIITVINSDTGEEYELIYEKQDMSKGKPFVMLLLGVDTEHISYGRSDTIVLAVIQPKKNKVSLLSVPRDSYITNQEKGRLDKINHAYNNGISNTISSLEEYFNIPINYYATVNMSGFMEVVDTIGGLEIDVEKDLTFYDRITKKYVTLNKGLQTLNGQESLNYTRFRGDAEGDFGRNRRQRQVITELIKQSADFRNVTKINELLNILKENFRTNINPLAMGVLLKQLDFGSNLTIESLELKATPARRNGLSVVIIDEEEKNKITQQIHESLGLTEEYNSNN